MRGFRYILAALGITLILALLAAWQLPARLNWARYRSGIAQVASAELGRTLRIDGAVRLTLLPQPMLVASRVTLADQGDGVSANIGTLRLQVALGALLRGHILPRDLVLDDITVNLPWPPRNAGAPGVQAPIRRRVAPGFSAQIERGTLHFGVLSLSNLTATLHADPDTGALGVSGSTVIAALPWRFSGLLGSPGADGVAALNLAVDGEKRATNTGGSFRGQITALGGMRGQLTARGPDLSRLLPGPAIPWQLQGPVATTGGTIEGAALNLRLGQTLAKARLAISLAAEPRLDIALSATELDLDPWAKALWPGAAIAIPGRIEISAQAATWLGGTLRDMHGILVLDPGRARLEHAYATLPGGAKMRLDLRLGQGPRGGAMIEGPASLTAPDLRATLRWLLPTAPAWLGALPPNALQNLQIAGTAQLQPGRLSVSDITGKLDGETLTGGIGVALGPRPGFGAGLTLDRVRLEGLDLNQLPTLPALGRSVSGADGDLHLRVNKITLPGTVLTGLAIDAQTGAEGLSVTRFVIDGATGHAAGTATLGASGALDHAHLSIDIADAAALLAVLPPRWRIAPGLWHGHAAMELAASGPPDQLAAQLRADLNDLRLEADSTVDLTIPSLAATLTLRHPGAPRLFEAIGIRAAGAWLDQGSFALLAHFTASPASISVGDFSLTAGILRIGGAIDADFSGDEPTIQGRLHADSLALPRFGWRDPTALPIAWLAGWRAALRLDATQISIATAPWAHSAGADLNLAGGVLAAENVAISAGGGSLTGRAALDTSQEPPVLALQGALAGGQIDAKLAGLPVDLDHGSADVRADILAAGHSPAAWLASASGDLQAAFRDAEITGLDLPGLTAVLRTRGPGLRGSLRVPMNAGNSPGLAGSVGAKLDHGMLTLNQASLRGPAGGVEASGTLDLAGQTADLRLAVRPAVDAPPAPGIRLVGPWSSAHRVVDIAPALVWAATPVRKALP